MKDFLSSNIKLLRSRSGESQTQLGSQLNKAHTTIGNWEKGIAAPSLEEIGILARIFEIDPRDLIYTDLSKGKVIPTAKEPENAANGKVNGKGIGKVNGQSGGFSGGKPGSFTPQVITVDNAGRENILYVPVKARLGYLTGFGDPQYLSQLEAYRLPGVRAGTFRMFESEGPSMAPTIHSGDRVVGQYVESLSDIRERRIYVVVTKQGIVIKRLLNRISERGKVVMLSDTIANRMEFPTYEIDYEEITELWEAKVKLSANFAEPGEIYTRVNNLESDLLEMRVSYDDMRAELSEFRTLIKQQLKLE